MCTTVVARDGIWVDDESCNPTDMCEREDTISGSVLQEIPGRENISADLTNRTLKVGTSWTQLREIEMLKNQLAREEKRRMQAETQLNESRATKKSAIDMQAQLQAKDRIICELQHRCEELESVQQKSQSQVWQAQKLESSFRKDLMHARAILNDCHHVAHNLCGENAFLPPDIARRRSMGGACAPETPSESTRSQQKLAAGAKVIHLDEWRKLKQEIEKRMSDSHREMQSHVDALRAQVEHNEKRIHAFRKSEQRLLKESNYLKTQLLSVKAVHHSVLFAMLGRANDDNTVQIEARPDFCIPRDDCKIAPLDDTCNFERSVRDVEVDLHATFAAAASSLEQAFEVAGMGSLGLQSEFERLSTENADIHRRLQDQEERIAELHLERQLLVAELSVVRADDQRGRS